MSYNASSQDLFLFRHCVATILSTADVLAAYEARGVTQTRLHNYMQLYETTMQAQSTLQLRSGDTIAARNGYDEEFQAMRRLFEQHTTIARHVLDDPADQARLQLNEPIPCLDSDWFLHAHIFYSNLQEAHLQKMSRHKVTWSEINATAQRLKELEASFTEVKAAEDMTRRAQEALARLHLELGAAARELKMVIALLRYDMPQLEELLFPTIQPDAASDPAPQTDCNPSTNSQAPLSKDRDTDRTQPAPIAATTSFQAQCQTTLSTHLTNPPKADQPNSPAGLLKEGFDPNDPSDPTTLATAPPQSKHMRSKPTADSDRKAKRRQRPAA